MEPAVAVPLCVKLHNEGAFDSAVEVANWCKPLQQELRDSSQAQIATLVDLALRGGRDADVVHLLASRDLPEGVAPSQCVGLVAACVERRTLRGAVSCLGRLSKGDAQAQELLTGELYGQVLGLSIDLQAWDVARDLYIEMAERDLAPDGASFRRLVRGLGEAPSREYREAARSLYEAGKEQGMYPSIVPPPPADADGDDASYRFSVDVNGLGPAELTFALQEHLESLMDVELAHVQTLTIHMDRPPAADLGTGAVSASMQGTVRALQMLTPELRPASESDSEVQLTVPRTVMCTWLLNRKRGEGLLARVPAMQPMGTPPARPVEASARSCNLSLTREQPRWTSPPSHGRRRRKQGPTQRCCVARRHTRRRQIAARCPPWLPCRTSHKRCPSQCAP